MSPVSKDNKRFALIWEVLPLLKKLSETGIGGKVSIGETTIDHEELRQLLQPPIVEPFSPKGLMMQVIMKEN